MSRITKLLDPVTSAPPLSSKAVLAISGLALLCLALLAALVLTAAGAPVEFAPAETTASPEDAPEDAPEGAPQAAPPAAPPAAPAPPTATVSLDSLLAQHPHEPNSIPATLLTEIEGAGDDPLVLQLGQLLDAVQIGFGDRSAQIEPTLRPYLFRIAGRLSVRTDSFRIAVTAPELSLAHARAATLRRTFDVAGVSESRVSIGTGQGPHAVSLVSD